jgi:hypothetical protein
LTIRIEQWAGQPVDRRFLMKGHLQAEEERGVGNVLLHHPLVQLYLVSLAAAFLTLIWEHLRHPPAVQDGGKKPARPVSGTPRQADKGGEAGAQRKAPQSHQN